jgi:transposase
MGKQATVIDLTASDRAELVRWLRSGSTQQRYVQRAQIIVAAAAGESSKGIAQRLGLRRATVSKWRTRFAGNGLAGLHDEPRSGQPRKYDGQTDQRVLALLDQPPPRGYQRWTGTLLAAALGDVPADQVWRILRRLNISLQQTKSWCVSTDPDFTTKAVDIVGLYLHPPQNAVVLCMDEKPSIQALQRAQGWLRLPNGKAITGQAHEYKRNGTTTLLAALEVATGRVYADHYRRRRRREFLHFMNQLVAEHGPDTQLHVVLDNLSPHQPKHDRRLARHANVHLHYTPTHTSWLHQIETWFSKLSRAALRGASFTSVAPLRQAIEDYIAAHNHSPQPFEWTQADVRPKAPAPKYANLRK